MSEKEVDSGPQDPERGSFSKALRWFKTILTIAVTLGAIWLVLDPTASRNLPLVLETGNFGLPPDDPRGFAEAIPAWDFGTRMELRLFISSEHDPFNVFRPAFRSSGESFESYYPEPEVVWKDVVYGDFNETRLADLDVTIPPAVQQGLMPLWLDIFMAINDPYANAFTRRFHTNDITVVRKLLTPRRPLLHAKQDSPNIVPHWYPNITLNIVSNHAVIVQPHQSAAAAEHVIISEFADGTGTKALYFPILFSNELRHSQRRYIPLNETTTKLPVRVSLTPTTFFRYKHTTVIQKGFEEVERDPKLRDGVDILKDAIFNASPWVYVLFALMIGRTLFKVLAYTSSLLHWNSRTDAVGISQRFVLMNVVVQLCVLLYRVEFNSDTTHVLAYASAFGLVVECWRFAKVSLNSSATENLTEEEARTQEYDKLGFKYMLYASAPLLTAFSAFSFTYWTWEGDGWYQFFLWTLTSFIFTTFGFVDVIPQLLINYKLKSVAHMPLSAIIYETISVTLDNLIAYGGFIACGWAPDDDSFCKTYRDLSIWARLGALRETLIFVALLVQWRIYRVDRKRVHGGFSSYERLSQEDAQAATELKKE